MIENEAQRISEANISVQCANLPNVSVKSFDMVFLDAPFDQIELFKRTLAWVTEEKIVNMGGKIYIESSSEMTSLEGFYLLRSKHISQVWIHLFKRVESE